MSDDVHVCRLFRVTAVMMMMLCSHLVLGLLCQTSGLC